MTSSSEKIVHFTSSFAHSSQNTQELSSVSASPSLSPEISLSPPISSSIAPSTEQENVTTPTRPCENNKTAETLPSKTTPLFDHSSTTASVITNDDLITPAPPFNQLATASGAMIVIMLSIILICGGLWGVILIRRGRCQKRGVKRERGDFFYPPIYINPSYSATVNHIEEDCIELENV